MNSFPRANRLRKNSEFKELFSKAKWIYTQSIILHYSLQPLSKAPKLGVAPSKRFGNAVRRNYFKRLARENFRLHKSRLPSNLHVVLRPQKSTTQVSFKDFENAFDVLINSLKN